MTESSTAQIFVSHATEDKDAIARPIAEELRRRGYEVWYDEFSLCLGDSLRGSIDRGLATCDYGVVVLSPSFFAKHWPKEELDGLAAREACEGRKVIFPIWHKLSIDAVTNYSPMLAAKLAARSSDGVTSIANSIGEAIRVEEARRGIREIKLTSPYGGMVSFRGVANPPSAMRLIDEPQLDEMLRDISQKFRKFMTTDETKDE